MESHIAVYIKDISFAYEEPDGSHVPIYECLSVELNAGEITAIMGGSGTGKSTLGKLLSGVLTPTAGVIEWSDAFSRELDHFYLDQDPAAVIFPWRTVEANIREPLEILHWPKARALQRSKEMMLGFEISHLADRFPKHISGGQQSRLALARVLAWRPKAIILDEYLADLDSSTRHRTMDVLRSLVSEASTTVVVISHSVADVVYCADRCIFMQGSPASIGFDLDLESMRASKTVHEIQQMLATAIAKAEYDVA